MIIDTETEYDFPTVMQVKAIIEYLGKAFAKFENSEMLKMKRTEPNKILIDLNISYSGNWYEVTFNGTKIETFKWIGSWIS